MTSLTQAQVESIAARVVANLKARHPSAGTTLPGPARTKDPVAGPGAFPTVDLAVQAAQKAFQTLQGLTLESRKHIIAAIRAAMTEAAEDLARRAHEETGLGRTEDKVLKNHLVTEKTPGTEFIQPRVVTGDRGLTLTEYAPYGVIGAITPVTNPTSTIICNTIGMVAAGNAVVFNVHPSAKRVSLYTVELINRAIQQAGGPANLVTTVAEPTIESAQELMHHPGVRLLVVTGGAAVVKAAMRSGKRAICAGPGNPPVVVDESADIEKAAASIVRGASTDNNMVCVLEKEIIAVESIAFTLTSALARHGALILKEHELAALEKVIFAEQRGPRTPAVMNKDYIGKDVQTILATIGIRAERDIRLAVAPVPETHPLVWTEQMMPVLPLVTVPTADQAIDLAKEAEHGFGHTAVMHSKNLDHLSRMAREMNCSIFVKNGPSLAGLGYGGEGYCSFSIASPTGEGLTSPVSFSRERRCVLVDHFRIV
ncbi:MAG: aldehyde dehydrogenase EutE [Candidatus Neomarinimicrobiota bacterium]|nr:MAG: aldehyde dehydrogenase EutE [Candidatus Neomarinimicrobiota bacterium]